MKIKKAVALCEKSRLLTLYDTGWGDQWISNGAAMYKLEGAPKLDTDQLCSLYDLDEKKLKNVNVSRRPAPDDLSLENTCALDRDAQLLAVTVMWNGRELQPVVLPDGLVFYATELYAPLTGPEEFRRVVVRRTPGGAAYFGVLDGTILTAIIMPVEGKSGSPMEKSLAELTEAVRRGYYAPVRTPDADPETGEVCDG